MFLDAVEIPDDLEWVDEFTWTPVAQDSTYGVTGSLYVQTGTKLTGRYITLEGKTDMGWITRTQALALLALRDVAGTEMTLTLQDARTFNVIFRQSEIPVELKTILEYNTFEAGEWLIVNSIKFSKLKKNMNILQNIR